MENDAPGSWPAACSLFGTLVRYHAPMDPEHHVAKPIVPDSEYKSVWQSVWKNITISGSVLTLLGYGFNGLFAYSHTPFNPPESWFAASMICVLIGIACLSIGQVGWIRLLGISGRTRITAFGFAFPIVLALIGYSSADGDPHGSFPIFFLPLCPLILVAFILVWLWRIRWILIRDGSGKPGVSAEPPPGVTGRAFAGCVGRQSGRAGGFSPMRGGGGGAPQ